LEGFYNRKWKILPVLHQVWLLCFFEIIFRQNPHFIDTKMLCENLYFRIFIDKMHNKGFKKIAKKLLILKIFLNNPAFILK